MANTMPSFMVDTISAVTRLGRDTPTKASAPQGVGQSAVLVIPVGDVGDLLLSGVEPSSLADDAVDVAHDDIAEAHGDEQFCRWRYRRRRLR